MQKDYIGTVNIKGSEAFTKFTKGICKTLKAEVHDISVVEVINLTERIDKVNGTNTIAKQASKLRLLAAWMALKVSTEYMIQAVCHLQSALIVVETKKLKFWRLRSWNSA